MGGGHGDTTNLDRTRGEAEGTWNKMIKTRSLRGSTDETSNANARLMEIFTDDVPVEGPDQRTRPAAPRSREKATSGSIGNEIFIYFPFE